MHLISTWLTRFAALLIASLVAGCASLPDEPHDRAASTHFSDTRDTTLGRAVDKLAGSNRQLTSVHALDDGRDAFVIRALLADEAMKSLDVQYYIWHDDLTGRLLLEHLWKAAQRGVRVRLLLDDNNTSGLDGLLARFNAQPNVQVRLFNPFAHRRARILDFLTDFDLANRRMHNKAFIADNQVVVLGGRNVGDEYFGAGNAMTFSDLDVLLSGEIVPHVSASFDEFWNSPLSYDAGQLLPAPRGDTMAELQRDFALLHAQPGTESYLESIRDSKLMTRLRAGTMVIDWTNARLIADHPDKVLGNQPDESTEQHIVRALGHAERSLDMVSPYFVPTADGTAALERVRQRGIRVRVLTNSLAATDVMAVHAGYARWRRELLKAGVRLFELKPQFSDMTADDTRRREVQDPLFEPGPRRVLGGSLGSSSASLHAKTFAMDEARIYVGSFNLDPRSARLNTELGAAIDSPRLARALSAAFESLIPYRAYELQLAANGNGLEWIDASDNDKVYTTEPATSLRRRVGVKLLSLLPIDGLL